MAPSTKSPVAILRALLFFIPWLLHLILANILLTLTLPFSWPFPAQIYAVNSQIAYTVWVHIQLYFERSRGAKITVSGDDLPRLENAIVIANHVSWTDFYLVQALAVKAGMLGSSRYFAKASLRWVPFLGWGMIALGMPMVSRNWVNDRKEFEALFEGIKSAALPIWLIAYSEGTRFTKKKWEDTKTFCESRGKPVFPHVLYPRSKGFVTEVQNLRDGSSHIKHVYDLTLAYSKAGGSGKGFMDAPTMWETFAMARVSPPWRFHVHVRRFEIKELPEDEEGLRTWLEERWAEKSRILQGMEGEWTEFEGLGEVESLV
ncbi:uncharacterized protein H6S33_002110 [Morchella sextelata]|uniref:uncharacterized protein n=1 Tax=Morchella sextelata TaxID=1174677 RepID=UPI001D038057|nr:uncharacterized protein H6S33_002110 [Morchella sextelata]KAH0608058.1 hypothetical protein H6S33_002110 [Morchella sextelata]